MNAGVVLLNLLVYPGFIFAAVVGLLFLWLVRKLLARFQWRVGPPIYQTFADVIKLLSKESVVPENANRFMFVTAPVLALAAVTLAMLLIPVGAKNPALGFLGDVIVLIYLLTIPSVAIIIGGSSSANPFGAIGASREISLTIAYELGLVLSVLTLCVDVNSLLMESVTGFNFLRYPLAAVALFICVVAKLGITPFDIPEAKTEIMAGPYTEYSGRLLGIFKLTHAMLLFALSSLFVSLFFAGPFTGNYVVDVLVHLVKCVLVVVVIAVVAAANPRLRIDQALRFFWGFVFVLALIDFMRALIPVLGWWHEAAL
ncbi:complex I subunit 1 family protein [Candidatus Alkanophaga liquidiphilum]